MLVAFSHLCSRNKVEIRSDHYEYQTTEVRLKQSILIFNGVAYFIMMSCFYMTRLILIFMETRGTEGLQHCSFKFCIDLYIFLKFPSLL